MEKKIINFKPRKSNVHNSPLLMSDEVEVKAYSENLNSFTKSTGEKTIQHPAAEQIQEPPKVEQQVQEPPKAKYPKDYSLEQPVTEKQSYVGDNTQDMEFSEEPEKKPVDESETMSPSEAKTQAEMMISMYSAFVPPALAKILKKDVAKVSRVMKFSAVPQQDIIVIEKFLNTKNSEIEKALNLSREQAMMLKQALSAVLERYKLSSDNPVVNLLVIVFGIAVTQFMTVTAIINAQFEQIKELIAARSISAPDGDEDFAVPQGFFKKKIQIKKAA